MLQNVNHIVYAHVRYQLDKKSLKAWLKENFGYRGSINGQVVVKVGKFRATFWFDPPADRMRIHLPICDATDVNHAEVLKANFHSTQDVHYAIHKGKLYSVYTHWLGDLTKRELVKAFFEVVNLAQNTLLGDFYSGDMILLPAYLEAEREKVTKQSIRRAWQKIIKETSKKKGKLFEDFVKMFVRLEPGFKIVKRNLRTKSEEIDILIQNKVLSPHWLKYNSPYIMVEAKNWNERIEAKHIRDFVTKIRNHEGYSTMGFFFSTSGFSKGCESELVGIRNTPLKLALIDGEMITKFLKGNHELREFIEEKLPKSIK